MCVFFFWMDFPEENWNSLSFPEYGMVFPDFPDFPWVCGNPVLPDFGPMVKTFGILYNGGESRINLLNKYIETKKSITFYQDPPPPPPHTPTHPPHPYRLKPFTPSSEDVFNVPLIHTNVSRYQTELFSLTSRIKGNQFRPAICFNQSNVFQSYVLGMFRRFRSDFSA